MKYILFILLCLTLPFAVVHADETDNESKDGTQVYSLSEDVNLVTTLKFTYGKHSMVAKSVFPQLECDSDSQRVNSFNQLINEIILEEVGGFQNQVDQYLADHRLAKSNGKSDLNIDYSTSAMKNGQSHIVSIRFSIQGYIAGKPRPFHYHRVINYDLENAQIFQLSDLFEPGEAYLDILSTYTQRILSRRLENKEMVNNGTAPIANNFKNWNIKTNGLLITFEESQVAPYIYGAQSVLVPYSVLKSIANKESPLANCFKNRRSCGHNQLLTGGFIDEAINMRNRRFNPILSHA